VRNFRNTGMIWAFEVETDDAAFARRFHQAALDRGVLLRPIANTVYFMPPYIIDESAIAWLVAGALAALNECLA
jgi:adenosylmethionine-8-amino-7-oxononanoate aminotransferase